MATPTRSRRCIEDSICAGFFDADMRGLVVSVALVALLALAIFSVVGDRAGPDPAKWLLHKAGFFALVFLVGTLSVSTLRRLMGRPALVQWRRPVGLAAFALATAHVVIYATLYQGLAFAPIAEDIGERPYILIGFFAWLLLLPLAFTSTKSARRRMGGAWSKLHRLIYLIVPLAIIHQGMAQKADFAQTVIFLLLAGCFLIERVLDAKGALPWVRKVSRVEDRKR